MEKISEIDDNNIKMNITDTDNENDIRNVSVSDLKSMISVLNICSQRGSFRINELKEIGTFYEKLNNYLNQKKM